MNIFTGSYSNCKSGNLVSISGDKGKSANFNGNAYTKLAPKRDFFVAWKYNTTLSEDENNKYYMKEFYKQVLSQLNPIDTLKELSSFGNNVIILCYEQNDEFCHRHLIATWLERILGMEIPEVSISDDGVVTKLPRNPLYVEQFNKIIDEFTI